VCAGVVEFDVMDGGGLFEFKFVYVGVYFLYGCGLCIVWLFAYEWGVFEEDCGCIVWVSFGVVC